MHHPLQRALQDNNTSSPGPNKTLQTYKDQRIQEIKKKYDAPNRKNQGNGKENMGDERSYRSVPRAATLTEGKERAGSGQFQASKANFNSMGRCGKDIKTVEISSFDLHADHQAQKAKTFSGVQNLHFKPAINQKLKAHQTQQSFFKPKQQHQNDLVPGIRCKQSYGRLNKRQANDSRINNICKINSKIKQLLQCIDDCERQELNQSVFFQSKVEGPSSILRRSIYSPNNNSCQLQQNKIIDKQSLAKDSLAANRTRSKQRIATEIPSLSQMRASHPTSQFSNYLTSYKNKLKQQENEALKRSRMENHKSEQRVTFLQEKYAKTEKEQINDGDFVGPKVELIEQEITKFQQKINELQEQKRKLNGRLKPYYFENSPIKGIHVSYDDQTFNRVTPKNETEMRQSRKALDLLQVKREQQAQLEHEARSYDNIQLRKKIGQRMEERRKRIQMFQQDSTPSKPKQTSQLISSLCEQVKLDEELRNSKNWFSECNNPQKVTILHQSLQVRHCNFTLEEVDQIFNNFRSDQSDPFFSFREEKYTIESVAETYLKCIKHWKEKLCHRWKADQLALQCFQSNFSNKMSVLIEDIVRLLNTQTGNFYRNRDVYLIYQRIKTQTGKTEQQRIGVADLLKVFT